MGKRQRRREREQRLSQNPPAPEIPERQDVTVTAGVASASGITSPDQDSED